MCCPDLLVNVSFRLQGDSKRELEYRAGKEQLEDGKEEADEEQPQKAEAEAPSKQPDAELPQDDQGAPEDGEGPMNEQAGDGAQQQDFTTPEACTRLAEMGKPVTSLTASHGQHHPHCEEQRGG